MKKSIVLIALGSIVIGASWDARAETPRGTCNAIIANALGPAQQFVSGIGDPVQQCTEVGGALLSFLNTSGCLDAYLAGEIKGLGGPASVQPAGPNAGAVKPVSDAICESICGCGLFPFLPPQICAAYSCP